MAAADLPLDNQLRTTSHLNDLSNFRRVLVGESLMMDSMVQDTSCSPSEKSKQPQSAIRVHGMASHDAGLIHCLNRLENKTAPK
jgi:hypothetical protein